ncbi:MAG: cytochrome c-type biogenesis protein CcmH [Solirubrobacteraceae bacterium]
MRRAALAAVLLLSLAVAAPASAVTARTSLVAIEQQVMCVTCGIPLQEADSPAAQQEKAYIQQLIDAGDTAATIKARLVVEYGDAVLALPPDRGFNVEFYLIPIAAVLAAIVIVALLLPRWRRNRRAGAGAAGQPDALSAADNARLDADLARFEP